MILVSKILWGSATVAMLAGSAVVPAGADVARELAAVVQWSTSVAGMRGPAPVADADAPHPLQIAPHCAGSCDVWASLARTR